MQVNLGAHLDMETLLTSDEAVLTAAASEVLALAKAAVKVAKDAATMAGNHKSTKAVGTSVGALNLVESDDREPSAEELEILEAQLSKSIAVRSIRRTERKFRRTRAAEKAAANTVSVKSSSSSRKKRSAIQDIDYSDPLRYLRGTTTTKLLTASEELELSEGIQVI